MMKANHRKQMLVQQLRQIESSISHVQAQIDSLDSQIDSLSCQIDSLNSQISYLQNLRLSLDAELQALQTQKKIVERQLKR